MKVKKHGAGVLISLSGKDVARAIDSYLVAHGIIVDGPRTVRVNNQLCEIGRVYVDSSGAVIKKGKRFAGWGNEGEK